MSTLTDLKALYDLKDSRGWAVLEEAVKDQINKNAVALGKNFRLSDREIDFFRISISAADNLLRTPDQLIQLLENELDMQAQEQTEDTDQ